MQTRNYCMFINTTGTSHTSRQPLVDYQSSRLAIKCQKEINTNDNSHSQHHHITKTSITKPELIIIMHPSEFMNRPGAGDLYKWSSLKRTSATKFEADFRQRPLESWTRTNAKTTRKQTTLQKIN